MRFLSIVGLIVSAAAITAGSMIYGYSLALKHIRLERQRQSEERAKYRKSDTPIYDKLADDFYDVI